jgi:hypothetical protein
MAAQPNVETEALEEGPRIPKADGYCANCVIVVDDHIVWCDAKCERIWREFQARKG